MRLGLVHQYQLVYTTPVFLGPPCRLSRSRKYPSNGAFFHWTDKGTHGKKTHSLFHGARSTVNSFVAITSSRKPGDQFSAGKEGTSYSEGGPRFAKALTSSAGKVNLRIMTTPSLLLLSNPTIYYLNVPVVLTEFSERRNSRSRQVSNSLR
jgi:hypothetical protein